MRCKSHLRSWFYELDLKSTSKILSESPKKIWHEVKTMISEFLLEKKTLTELPYLSLKIICIRDNNEQIKHMRTHCGIYEQRKSDGPKSAQIRICYVSTKYWSHPCCAWPVIHTCYCWYHVFVQLWCHINHQIRTHPKVCKSFK